MAVRIRLKRMGRRNHAFYRIGVFDSRTRRDGRAIEELGHYDPHITDETKKYTVNVERAEHWLSKGALPSNTCKQILLKTGVTVPGCTAKKVLSEDEILEKKRGREEKIRKREEAHARKAISQPKKLSKKEMRAAKRAGG